MIMTGRKLLMTCRAKLAILGAILMILSIVLSIITENSEITLVPLILSLTSFAGATV